MNLHFLLKIIRRGKTNFYVDHVVNFYMKVCEAHGNKYLKEARISCESRVGNFNPKFQPVRNKTNRENTCQRKQSHAQDNIYVVRQFAYVHGVTGISLLLGKIQ